MPRIEVKKDKLVDKYKVKAKNGKWDSNHSDMFSVNRRLKKGEAIESLQMTRSGRTVEVNLANGSIFVDSKKVDLQLDEFPADFRWINFNRVYAGYGVDGSKSESVICVVGWQGNLKNGSNVKRMVAVYPNGRAELWEENEKVLTVL